jgi:hypothetical protein
MALILPRLRASTVPRAVQSLPVMRGYIRSGTLFKENAAAEVGL